MYTLMSYSIDDKMDFFSACGPICNTVVATGDTDAFPHWFSTKPWCGIVGVSEYQYRKYNPVLGRWLSRAPLHELGFKGLSFSSKVSGVVSVGATSYVITASTYCAGECE